MTARRVGLMNPAGSTAKSTTTAALAHLAHEAGWRVLAVDLDPQANLTEWLGGGRDTGGISQALKATAANDPAGWPGVAAEDVLADRARQVRRTVQTTPLGPDLIAADVGLRALARHWTDLRPEAPERLLAEALDTVVDTYDLVLVDCKGDLGVLTEAALRACDEVIGVASPTTKAMAGLGLLAAETARVDGVEFRAVVPAQIRPRNRGADADDLYQLMQETYDGQLTPPVRGASNLDAAYTTGQPVTAYDPGSGVSADLRAVYADLRAKGVLP